MSERGYFYTDPNKAAATLNLPTKLEECESCHGTGARALGGASFTAAEMDEQGPEFAEQYFAGAFDKPCGDCEHGQVRVIDEARCTPQQLKEFYREADEIRAANAESLAEMRMGC